MRVNKVNPVIAIESYRKQQEIINSKKFNIKVNLEFDVEVEANNYKEAKNKTIKEMKDRFPFANIIIK